MILAVEYWIIEWIVKFFIIFLKHFYHFDF